VQCIAPVLPQEAMVSVKNSTLSIAHNAELAQSGIQDLGKMAYFTADRYWVSQNIGYDLEGLIIPYNDPYGVPYKCGSKGKKDFFRIKPDWDDRRRGKKPPKYLSPAGEGNRPYWATTYQNWDKFFDSHKIPAIWTEGEKKATLSGQLGYATIAFAGVDGWVDSQPRKGEVGDIGEDGKFSGSRPLPELQPVKDKNIWQHRPVYIAYDSDVTTNPTVRSAIMRAAFWLTDMGAIPYIVRLPNELDEQKNGIDDLVVRHGRESLDLLIRLARPAVGYRKGERYLDLPAEPDLQTKSAMTWAILKDEWRWHTGLGWHRWNGKFWSNGDDADPTGLDRDIYQLHVANQWSGQGSRSLNDAIRYLKSNCTIERDRWNPRNLIGFANGVLNTDTGNFSAHHRNSLLTFLLPFDYDPLVKSPIWERTLGESVGGDNAAIRLVRAMFRWAIEPKPRKKTDVEHCWDLYGEPGTGKGTILDTLTSLIGEQNCGGLDMSQLGNANALAAIIDRPVTISYDDFGLISNPGTLNKIISNEPVGVKLLYKDVKQTRLNTFLIRAYNKVLPTPNGSQGFDRRLIVMRFNHKPSRPDPQLQAKINAELSGIFNWVWAMPLAEAKATIAQAGKVEAVQAASIKRFEDNNPSFVFLREKYSQGAPNGVKPRDLYQAYSDWCGDEGISRLTHRNFTTEIERFGCYQRGKIMGFKLYIIPAMADFNIMAHLGLDRAIDDDSIPVPGRNFEEELVTPLQFPSNAPKENLDLEPISDNLGALGAKLDQENNLETKEDRTLFDLGAFDDERLYNPHLVDSIEGDYWDDPLPQPSAPTENRQLGGLELVFENKQRARDWSEYLSQTQQVSVWSPKRIEKKGCVRWIVKVTGISPDRIQILRDLDLSTSPPKQRLW
jgi:putative DNA primase/helicase